MNTIGLSDYSNDVLNKSMFTNNLQFPTVEQAEQVIEDNFKKGLLSEETYKQARAILDKDKTEEIPEGKAEE